MDTPGEPAPPLPLLAPMLATTAAGLPSDQDRWAFEAKLDGFRAVAYLDRGRLEVRSRAGKPMHPWAPELAAVAQALPARRLILDGELVALVDGKPSMEALQQRQRSRQSGGVPLLLAVFDLLYLDGELLTALPYHQRRGLLEALDLPGEAAQLVPAVVGDGDAMRAAVTAQDLEGVLAKRLEGRYQPGKRSRDWLKILNRRRARVLVGGWVPAARGGLAALLVGDPDPAGRLRFVGRVDLSGRARRQFAEVLAPLEIPHRPFTGPVGAGGWGRDPGPPPHWVQPALAVEVDHLGREPSGRLRHPRLTQLLPAHHP